MLIRQINPDRPDQKIILQAAKAIELGKVVICPTDTVYILATNALNPVAIEKVFKIKGREEQKPIHVNVKDFGMADKLVEFNTYGTILFHKFLPGPLTIVLPKKDVVPNALIGGLPTLGIRIPNCLVTLKISAACPVPYTTTSANPSGGKNPYSIKDALGQFDKNALSLVDLVLDAGELSKTPPSTIVDATANKIKVLRKGPVGEEEIVKVLDGD